MRYLKASLLVGVSVAAVVSLLMYFGAFVPADRALCQLVHLPVENATTLHSYQFAVIALCALAAAWATIDITRHELKWVVAVAALLEIAGMLYVASLFGVYFSPLPGGAAVILSFAAGLVYSRSKPGQRKMQLRQLLGSRISDGKFRQFLDDKSPIQFAGHVRNSSIVVCRVFNHDDLMDGVDAVQYVSMINRWLGCSAEFLVEQGGYLDECNGEGVRCVFGGIMDEPGHERLALDCALELESRLRNLNGEIEAEWHRQLDFAIGVNSGDIVAATYGGAPLSTFSASGEVVDFAWRLPRIGNDYRVPLAVGSQTFVACEREFIFRPIDMVYGADGVPVEIYQPLGRTGEVDEDRLAAAANFWQAVVLIREGETGKARELLATLSAEDPLVGYYSERLRMRESFEGADNEFRRLSDTVSK